MALSSSITSANSSVSLLESIERSTLVEMPSGISPPASRTLDAKNRNITPPRGFCKYGLIERSALWCWSAVSKFKRLSARKYRPIARAGSLTATSLNWLVASISRSYSSCCFRRRSDSSLRSRFSSEISSRSLSMWTAAESSSFGRSHPAKSSNRRARRFIVNSLLKGASV